MHLYEPGRNFTRHDSTIFQGLDDPALAARLGAEVLAELREGRLPAVLDTPRLKRIPKWAVRGLVEPAAPDPPGDPGE